MKLFCIHTVPDNIDVVRPDTNVDKFMNERSRHGNDPLGSGKGVLLPTGIQYGVEPLVKRVRSQVSEGKPAAPSPGGMNKVCCDNITWLPGYKAVRLDDVELMTMCTEPACATLCIDEVPQQ